MPRGYALRLPGAQPPDEIAAGWARLPPAQRYLAQRNEGTHKMRKGETLAGLAAASGVTLGRLLAANGFSSASAAVRGTTVRVPMPASRADVGGAAADGALAGGAAPGGVGAAPGGGAAGVVVANQPGAPSGISAHVPAPLAANVPPPAPVLEKGAPPPREPVSARQTNANSLLPVASPTGGSDTSHYEVGDGNTVIVQAAETLGHFADWTQTDSQSLRTLNKLHNSAMVTQGRKLRLDLSKVTAAQFVAARRDYHRHLQETFFAAHRIAGTASYQLKRGDSLWTVAQKNGELPVWLVAQYNPDVNFADVRAGTALTLPQVVAINRQ